MSQLQSITARIEKLRSRASEIETRAKAAGIRQIAKIMSETGLGLEELNRQLGAKAAFSASSASPGSKRVKLGARTGQRIATTKTTKTTKKQAKGFKGAIKYRDPSDPTKAWTGHGRAPNWIVGKDREKFRVQA